MFIRRRTTPVFLFLIVVFTLYAVVEAGIIPSYKIKDCKQTSGLVKCTDTMLVSIAVDDTGLGAATKFTIDSLVVPVDSNGVEWNVKEPINVEISRTDPIVEFEQVSQGIVKNAFEQQKKLGNGEKCNNNEFCCSNGYKRWISFNSTEYYLFSIGTPSLLYHIRIDIYQNDISYTLFLNPQSKTVKYLGITASLEYDLIQLGNTDFRNYMYVVESSNLGKLEGFIVPMQHFGDGVNRIGISQEMYNRKVDCLLALGSITKIGDSVYDQFYGFRSRRVSSDMGCTFNPQQQNSLYLQCAKTSSTTLLLELPIKGNGGFKIEKFYGNPYIVGKGALLLQSTKTTIYVDVFNDIDSTGKIEVELNSCCFKKGEKQTCSDSKTVAKYVKSVGPYDTKRVYFSVVPTLTDFDNGFCIIAIGQYGKVEKEEEVSFSMKTVLSEPTTTYCYPPKLKTIVGGRVVCITDCPTADTIYNETIYQCVPVDCSIKYRGLKEFFNHLTLKCEEKKKCEEWKENYDYNNNLCITKKEYETKPSSNYEICTENDLTSSNLHSLNCGYGYMDRMGTICTCPNGFVTSAESNLFCDINLNDIKPVPASLELPKPTFFESLCDLPNWAQILLIAIFIVLLLSPIPLGIIFVFCCIKKIDPKKEAMKRKYGELKKKSVWRRIQTAVVKGDFSAHEYKITDEKKEQLKLSTLEKKKLQKKKKKECVPYCKKGE
ncbi:hypothetical protein ABK040_006226 [Willaertia magna]